MSHIFVAALTGLVSLLGIVFTGRNDVKWLREGLAKVEARLARIESQLFKHNRG